MTGGAGIDGLNGTQKAAMFMLAAGQEHASRLCAKLDLEEIRDITQAMSRLGRVSGEHQDRAVRARRNERGVMLR
jgi:flagellar motor switch protein FliG